MKIELKQKHKIATQKKLLRLKYELGAKYGTNKLDD